jgi:hypothetical protein
VAVEDGNFRVRKERAYVFWFKGERKKYTTMKKVKNKI